jgi:hypothetical protein
LRPVFDVVRGSMQAGAGGDDRPNRLKLIHAQQTEKVKAKPARPAPMWSVTSACANSDAATPNAMTNVRSNSSSNGVATRCVS